MSSDMVKNITDAIGAHGAWKLRLRTAINTGRSDAKPSDVRCDDRCALGEWLHGPAMDTQTRSGLPYQVTKRLHAEFHGTAADVLTLALDGRKDEASSLLNGDFTARSERLVRALTKWKGLPWRRLCVSPRPAWRRRRGILCSGFLADHRTLNLK